MSDRPNTPDDELDVVSDVLGAVRLDAFVFGRYELSAPWAVRIPAAVGRLAFYVLASGGAWLEVEGAACKRFSKPLALSAGDLVLLPQPPGLVLRDSDRGARDIRTLSGDDCPRPTRRAPVRFGGDGALTSFVAGAFRLGVTTPNALLDSLPSVVYLPASEARMNPQLAAATHLILAESAAPGPGSSILSSRLAEILLIHVLRAWVESPEGAKSPGLCALADPAIGTALRLIHERPAEAWTVERLAREVMMSRSAFAARFTALVGVPPLHYATQWRMTEAAHRLREHRDSVAYIAEQVGYRTPASFMKAFTRVHGVGPGTYRRNARR